MRFETLIEPAAHGARHGGVEFGDGDRFVPGGKLLDHLARCGDDERRAVEYELVLAADTIDVHDRHAVLARSRAHLLASQRLLPRVVRRAVGHDDDLRAGGLRARGRLGKPHVLADDRGDAHAGDFEHAWRGAGLEIALLVEHRVVRQAGFSVDLRDTAVADHRHRIVPPAFARFGEADQRRDATDLARQRGELRGAGVEKRRAQQKVLGGITAQRQLGRDHQVGAAALARGDCILQPRGVAGEIAQHLVQLRDRDPHRKMLARAGNESVPRWTNERRA